MPTVTPETPPLAGSAALPGDDGVPGPAGAVRTSMRYAPKTQAPTNSSSTSRPIHVSCGDSLMVASEEGGDVPEHGADVLGLAVERASLGSLGDLLQHVLPGVLAVGDREHPDRTRF